MVKRPWSVTVICIFIIVVIGIGTAINIVLLANHMPIRETTISNGVSLVNILCLGIGAIMFIAGSILALKRVNTGRWLIVVWCIISIVLYSDSLVYALPRIVHTVIVSLMLFNKAANRFFRSGNLEKSY
ncbi:hypothetical protein SK066_07095 [Paenibacillus hunanensis]|uniref:hypothetical protein n=1 Tax=Paenibacillus hunanensis TaxID=539262 RepID=UPI002A6B8A93|nr:hypothetical protein [Paenibacillus hunanensis]WPP42699.1 hypothetical protein SK066_07095 [Paenibacillus hunanensis]